MDNFASSSGLTVGQALARLREQYRPANEELAKAIHASYTTYLKTERDQRELSFVMALKLCRFYGLDIHEFIAMLSDEELDRKDFAGIRVQKQRERKQAELAQAKVIGIETGKIIKESQ
jgi:DNA-binding XRE family transcriptional regulator